MMAFRDLPIQQKVMSVIMLTSVTVLILTGAAFMMYDLVTYRQMMVRNLATTAAIITENSTAALAFQNPDDATHVLASLHAEQHVVTAALRSEEHTSELQSRSDLVCRLL